MKKVLAPAVIAAVGALSLTALPAIADATASPTKTAEAEAAATSEKTTAPEKKADPAPKETTAPEKKSGSKAAPASNNTKKDSPTKAKPVAKSSSHAEKKASGAQKESSERRANEKTPETTVAAASSTTPLFGDPVDATEIRDNGLSVKLTGLKPNSKVFGTARITGDQVGARTAPADGQGELTLQLPYTGSTTRLTTGTAVDVHVEFTKSDGGDGSELFTTHVGKEIEEAPLATLKLGLPYPAPKQTILDKGFPIDIADVKPDSDVETTVRLSTPGSPIVAQGTGKTAADGTGRIEAPFTGDPKDLTTGVIASVRVEYTRTDGSVYTTTLSTSIADDPTKEPTTEPTVTPTDEPTDDPTGEPTDEPTDNPTDEPTTEPTSPAPTSDPTDTPTSPGSHTNTEARLIVSPHRLTPTAFTTKNKGVDIAATKLEPGQAVTFTVKPRNSHVKAYTRTIVSNADGVAGWKIYGTNPNNPSAYLGTYDVTANIPPVPDNAHADSAGGEAAHAGGTVARAGAPAAQQEQEAKQGKTRVLEDSFTVGNRSGANPGDNGSGGDSGSDDNGSSNGSLPRTGAQLGGLAIGGSLLLVGGAAVMITRRRTKA